MSAELIATLSVGVALGLLIVGIATWLGTLLSQSMDRIEADARLQAAKLDRVAEQMGQIVGLLWRQPPSSWYAPGVSAPPPVREDRQEAA